MNFFPYLRKLLKKGDNLSMDYFEDKMQVTGVVQNTDNGEKVYTLFPGVRKKKVDVFDGINNMSELQMHYVKTNNSHKNVNSEDEAS